MEYRNFGSTGWAVSEVSLGTWQVGGKWGSEFDDTLADSILNEAIDGGVNFIDTADVYENRKSEAAVARVVRSRSERVYVATKCGRFLDPHVDTAYTPKALTAFVEASLQNTGFEVLDLVQLHCPPTQVYYRPEIFGVFEKLRDQGKILHLGVSVEKVEEALKAIEFPNVASVQIIYNIFRQRPAELFFAEAAAKGRAILTRVPLASGLLSGKFGADTKFSADDHRAFNREGAAFDKGETFAGVPYDLGLKAVQELEAVLATPMAESALRWILADERVSTVIPGASSPAQASANLGASGKEPLAEDTLKAVREVYERLVKPLVHQAW